MNTVATCPPVPPTREARETREVFPEESLAVTLDRMAAFHKRFTYHPHDSTHDLMVLWAAHTHAMGTWRSTPRLYITAGEESCGKSTEAEVTAMFSWNGQRVDTTSTAGLLDLIGKYTLFLDEGENLFTQHWDRNTLTAVINGGYLKGGSVLRKDAWFATYGPLAIAGVENGRLPVTTRSRCIPIQMRRALAPLPLFDPWDHEDYAHEVQRRLTQTAPRWQRVTPDFATGREAQLWTPLWAVAVAAGGGWPDRCRTAFDHHRWEVRHTEANIVLRASRNYFTEHTDADRVQSSVLADYIRATEDTVGHFTRQRLKGIMQGYRVEPRKISRMFYFKADLAHVWDEWLVQGV